MCHAVRYWLADGFFVFLMHYTDQVLQLTEDSDAVNFMQIWVSSYANKFRGWILLFPSVFKARVNANVIPNYLNTANIICFWSNTPPLMEIQNNTFTFYIML